MRTPYYKCNANGNSFIIITHRNFLQKKIFNTLKITKLCNSYLKSKIDGFILVNIKNNDIKMDYYNNDGSWETFCLNGLSCVSLILNQELNKNIIKIQCNKIIYRTKIFDEKLVQIELNKPIYKVKNLNVNGMQGNYINSGAKHFVVKFEDEWPSQTTLLNIFRKIRYSNYFKPIGTNVNFYKVLENDTLEVKTYEKGIESIMQSCSSGSYACAFDYSITNNIFNKINVLNDGGNSQIMFNEKYKNNLFRSIASIDDIGEVEV